MGYAICQYANKEDAENTKNGFMAFPQVCPVDSNAHADRGHGDICIRVR